MNASKAAIRWQRAAGVATAVAGILLGVSGAGAKAADGAGYKTIRGSVDRFTTAPKGEVDGAVLNDGTVVHWPPHVAAKVSGVLATKDAVRVIGRQEKSPTGEELFEAQTITNVGSGETVEVGDVPPPKGRKGAKGPKPGQAVSAQAVTKTVRGTVQRLTTAPRGEVDGVVLEDGTVMHWPPHLEGQFKEIVARGDRVQATGRLETDPKGQTHFEVQTLTNLRTEATRTADDGAAPAQVGREPGRDQRLRALEDRLADLQQQIRQLRREK